MATTATSRRGGTQMKSEPGGKVAASSSQASSRTASKPQPTSRPGAAKRALRGIRVTPAKTHQFGSIVSFDEKSLDGLIVSFARATPLDRIEAERVGVGGSLVKALAKSMGMPNVRMFEVIGVPKATAEKRVATNTPIAGAAGQSALGMVRLLGIAKDIVANSDAIEAKDFDTAKWLGRWIERPQPSLGGRKPADVLDTPTGVEVVVKLLGALESGAYL